MGHVVSSSDCRNISLASWQNCGNIKDGSTPRSMPQRITHGTVCIVGHEVRIYVNAQGAAHNLCYTHNLAHEVRRDTTASSSSTSHLSYLQSSQHHVSPHLSSGKTQRSQAQPNEEQQTPIQTLPAHKGIRNTSPTNSIQKSQPRDKERRCMKTQDHIAPPKMANPVAVANRMT